MNNSSRKNLTMTFITNNLWPTKLKRNKMEILDYR